MRIIRKLIIVKSLFEQLCFGKKTKILMRLDTGVSKEVIERIDLKETDEKDCLKCDGACFERKGTIVCRQRENDVRGIHINEQDSLIFPNNVTFSVASSKSSNFSFEFRTLKQFGVLWLEGAWSQAEDGGDFVLVFIDEGKLYVGVNLGADVHLKPISTNVTVADNHWHSVAFRRKERKCELWVDSKKILHVVSSPGDTILDTNGLVYLGGANPKKHKLLKSLDLTNKFVGCVKNLKIFGKEINLLVDSLKSVETPKYCHG
ncbi:hypothetical protein CRE_26223 [Caenorhabditis remanei]|uniref:Laminin G domain-containing protein n=1 Tax=Caenorhabditis remanei TaxID=31234 RepID=E3LQV1_CAERE|nr:hypothetical protein CRE_26223 [Caenorhabditis remanei]